MRRTEQKQQTYELLLKTALEEFARGGFVTTKTLDIARSADVSHGTLFVHFPTREELLVKVVDEFGVRIGRRLQQLAAGRATAEEILSAHLEVLREHEGFYAHLVVEGPLLAAPVRHRIFMIQSGIAHYLEKVIPKGMSLPFVLNSWLGLIHYYLANRDLFAPQGSVIAKCGQDLLSQFIKTQFKRS
jgi:AcrR family transcriptional regulator